MRRQYLVYLLTAIAAFVPAIASAHAFGQQYTLPLPFQLYAEGAVGALVASFVVLALYSGHRSERADIAVSFGFRSRFPEFFLRVVGLVCFVLTLSFAFFGSNNFIQNPTPILFWAVLFLGMTYVSAVVDGLWRFLNPFDTIVRILFLGRIPNAFFKYPAWLGYWPAVAIYFALISLELLSNGLGALPVVIGVVLLWYAFISCSGAILFGPDAWFKYGDFFSVFFQMLGRFAPFHIEQGCVRIQLPGERLVSESAQHISALVFILFMLSSTSFDGLHATQIWWDILYGSELQMRWYALEEFFALLISPFVFLALYGLAIYGMWKLTGARQTYARLLLRFAYSLIPIAIAYNFAHYFVLLAYEVQTLIPLMSDPFAKGWNIFGSAVQKTSIVLIGAQEIWYTQFGVILMGHIVATYVAHRIAVREFDTPRNVIVGQLPVLILMVFYTVFGLWILSQAYQSA